MDQPSIANAECDENGIPYFRWPPFPDPPPGVVITPFNEFKPAGIQMSAELEDEGPELDGLGIPTVKLPVKHDPHGHPKKRKKTRHKYAEEGYGGTVWWEEWEIGESLRNFSYSRRESQVDRLMQALQDFETKREWPPSGLRVRDWFNKFIVHIGLNSLSLQPTTTCKTRTKDNDEDEMSDEVSEEATEPNEAPTRVGEVTDSARTTENSSSSNEALANFMKKLERMTEEKEQRLELFLSDPELSVKIFFSSHFRDTGMIWEPPALRDAPRVVLFFLQFLLRNRVLAESEKPFQAALSIAERAKAELWETREIGIRIPDKLGKCLIELYGSRVQQFEWPASALDDSRKEEPKENMKELEGGAKQETLSATGEFGKRELPENDSGTTGEIRTDAAVGAVITEPAENAQGWSSAGADSNWATNIDSAAISGWGDETDENKDPWGTQGISNDWFEPEHKLEDLIGPTTFPVTRTVGYVESSTRFVSGWNMPDITWEQNAKQGQNINSSKDLFQLFARVELSPYSTYSDDYYAAIQKPEVLEDPFKDFAEEAEPIETNLQLPRHDPERDTITLLMDPALVGHLVKGIGIGGTFVQVIPDLDAETSSTCGDGRAHKAESKTADEIFWYAEKVLQVIPSFWTEKP